MSICNYAILWREAPSAPPLGELLSEREAEGVCYEIQDTLQNTNDTLSVSPFGLPAFNRGMIATGNHNFEKFAALCNTLSGAPRALRAGVCIQLGTSENPGLRAADSRPYRTQVNQFLRMNKAPTEEKFGWCSFYHSFSSTATPWGRHTMMPMVSSVKAGV